MYSYLDPDTPLVFVCNSAEAFFDYMNRGDASHRLHLIREMQALSDRALLYPCSNKLVFTSLPVPHKDLLAPFGYAQTQHFCPRHPSPFLSLDLLRESELLNKIWHHATHRRVQLIAHATTPEFLKLVQTLEQDYGLEVLLPESPNRDCAWVRDYIDTKAGFRHLAATWLPDAVSLLPEGYICHTLEEAAQVAFWFAQRGQRCLVKSDRGNDALGHTIISPAQELSFSAVYCRLKQNSFLQATASSSSHYQPTDYLLHSRAAAAPVLIVEEFIVSSDRLFPSAEYYVPPLGEGKPQLTYVCNQLFLDSGTFSGIVISAELEQRDWYSTLVSSGAQIAAELQKMGYVGHFDLDAVVQDDGRVALLEVNARRTGGTHVHELACFLLGEDYGKEKTLLSNTAMSSGTIADLDELVGAIAPLLYPMQSSEGVVITHSSNLKEHKFGYVLVAGSIEAALALRDQLSRCLLAS